MPRPASSARAASITCEVTDVKDGGIDVKIAGSDLVSFIKRNELCARPSTDQRPERFAVGEKVDARITQFDQRTRVRCPCRSRRWRLADEKEAIAHVRLGGFRRLAGRHPRCRAEGARQEGRRVALRALRRSGTKPGGRSAGLLHWLGSVGVATAVRTFVDGPVLRARCLIAKSRAWIEHLDCPSNRASGSAVTTAHPSCEVRTEILDVFGRLRRNRCRAAGDLRSR